MNHFIKLKISNDGIEKNFIGKVWCEYSSKKARKEVLIDEIIKIVSKELSVSKVELSWHPYKYHSNFSYSIEKYDESIHDILFPENDQEDFFIELKKTA